jgi:hypothetical protein
MIQGECIVPKSNIIKFESLTTDFDALMEAHGDKYQGIKLTGVKPTNVCAHEKKFTKANLSKKAKKLIQKIYERDFELFEYESGKEIIPGAATTAVTADATKEGSQSQKRASNGVDGETDPDKKRSKAETLSSSAAAPSAPLVVVPVGGKLSIQAMLRLRKEQQSKK